MVLFPLPRDPESSLNKLKQGVDNSLQAIYEAEEAAGLFGAPTENAAKDKEGEEQAAKRAKH